MPNLETPNTPLRVPIPPRADTVAKNPTLSVGSQTSRVLLVDFRSGEAVHVHPDLAPLLKEGWRVKSAVPRLVEGKGIKLLVVLTRGQRVLS